MCRAGSADAVLAGSRPGGNPGHLHEAASEESYCARPRLAPRNVRRSPRTGSRCPALPKNGRLVGEATDSVPAFSLLEEVPSANQPSSAGFPASVWLGARRNPIRQEHEVLVGHSRRAHVCRPHPLSPKTPHATRRGASSIGRSCSNASRRIARAALPHERSRNCGQKPHSKPPEYACSVRGKRSSCTRRRHCR